MRERYLLISDLQIPFEAQNALKFCLAVAKEYRIKPENVYCVGDEVDQYFGSAFKRDPDGWHTANSELSATRDKLRKWYRTFPQMKLAISNHGLRWAKKAWEAEIPSQMLIPYQKLIEAPKTWVWKEQWIIKAEKPFRMIHGMGYSGMAGHINAAIDGGINTAIGHIHSFPGVNHIQRSGLNLWAMNAGCLIDVDAYAFNYGKYNRNKPGLSVGVVLDGGRTPVVIPYEG